MKRLISILIFLFVAVQLWSQNSIRVQVENMVALDEQFNVTFIIDGENSPVDFQWSQGNDFQLVWGPQKGSSTSIQIINGKRSKSVQTNFTYVLMPKKTGTFTLPRASAKVNGRQIYSEEASVQVVSNGASSSSSPRSSSSSAAATGDIASGDLFMRLSLSRSSAVIGEPITATLKLYQRVNIAGFENAKFPSFNGFWSQETYAPTNIQFRRETIDDKLYQAAVIRSWVIIPQQAGALKVDPAELVCLVNVETSSGHGSIFDEFFDTGYQTVRKRVTTPALTVNVRQLPSGQPSSFGGGVGKFTMDVKLDKDSLKTHDAASLMVTVQGRGNVSLLEAPTVKFPADFEAYDEKTTDNTDKSNGGTSGGKTFEFPFIPRSHGDFTIDPVEYSYYDVEQGKYVTLRSAPIRVHVAKGEGVVSDAGAVSSSAPSVEKKGVKDLAKDIRFIKTEKPSLKVGRSFFAGSPAWWILLGLFAAAGAGVWLAMRKAASMRANVALSRNRGAVKAARNRLKKAGDFLSKNLYSAFYEELHRALLGYASDKLNMGVEELDKDNIASRFAENGVSEEVVGQFIGLLDACDYARYSPDAGHEAMSAHYESAVTAISNIESQMKGKKKNGAGAAALVLAALLMLPSAGARADAYLDSLWTAGTEAYQAGRWDDAVRDWSSLENAGVESAEVYTNLGDAYFKGGDYTRSILCYERALKVDPSYSDARYNLAYANTFIQDKIDPVPEFFLKSWARNFSYIFTSDTWAVLALSFFALVVALFLLFLLGDTAAKRRLGFFAALAALILSLISAGCSFWGRTAYTHSDGAIVISPVCSVKSSPSRESATDLFVLHEGTKVRILDQVGEWKNVELADGRQGWVKFGDIEII